MALDIAGLKRFQDTFGPVLAAIPAVLDAAAQMDDLNRGIALKRVELEKAIAEVQKTYDDADARITSVNEVLASAQADAAAAKAEAKEIRSQAVARAKASDAKIAEAQAAADVALASKHSELAGLEQAYALKKMEAEAAHAAVLADLEAKAKDAEKRLATAEKALDALKSKLG